ncbi:pre-rRNA processing protein [Coemansia sp. Benny D115]|nr:pre-rRNA processing protein [Coemansia sp. Benny D115]
MAKDRFLAQGVTTTKRQRNGKPAPSSHKQQQQQRSAHKGKAATAREGESEDEVGDIDNLEHRYGADENELSSDGEDAFLETAAEKRLRLAKDYIGQIKKSTELGEGEYDAEQIDRDLIAERLMTDARERGGRWSRQIADQFAYPVDESTMRRAFYNGHRLPVTCVAVTPNGQYVYSGAKDGSLIKWQRTSSKPLKIFPGQRKTKPAPNHNLGHCDHILCIAISSDGKYVATGGRDRRIHIWSVDEDRHLVTFHQHKDAVTGLVFRRGSNQLYSCAADRMVKVWNIDELAYMDTLFGHQDSITAIDALQREHAVTTGGRDKTVRLWKVADEAQLVFRGGATTDQHRITKALSDEKKAAALRDGEGSPGKKSALAATLSIQYADLLRTLAANDTQLVESTIDAVAMIDEETYVTGGDSGTLSLWSIHKKKPVFLQHVAHGVHPSPESEKEEGTFIARPRWITALAAVPLTDLFLSASSDGYIRMWRMRSGKSQGFDLVNAIPVAGYVNGLAVRELAPRGDILATKKDLIVAAAIGQEPRLGRWEKEKIRNGIKVFYFSSATPPKADLANIQ